jgi:Fe2+ transport system protein FeoA
MTTLSDLTVGDKVRITGLRTGKPAYRKKLLDMGLTKGTKFTLIRKAPLGDPIEISVRGFELILRKKEAEILEVEKIE